MFISDVMHPTGNRNGKQGQSLRAKAVVNLCWLFASHCHDTCMARNFGTDLEFLKRLAFRRAERSGPLLERFRTNERRIERNANEKIIWLAYAWLCVPLSLWPIDFDGLSRHLLECVESEKPLELDIVLLLELVGPPPDEKTISVVGEFEHVVESGNYDHLVKRPEKFTEIESSLKRDPALANPEYGREGGGLAPMLLTHWLNRACGCFRRKIVWCGWFGLCRFLRCRLLCPPHFNLFLNIEGNAGRDTGCFLQAAFLLVRLRPREMKANWKLYLQLFWETGEAQSDAASMTAEDVDWQSQTITYAKKSATDEHRTLAKAMLKVKGVNVTKPGTTVRLTPPRR
jgi:hypothetical protein